MSDDKFELQSMNAHLNIAEYFARPNHHNASYDFIDISSFKAAHLKGFNLHLSFFGFGTNLVRHPVLIPV